MAAERNAESERAELDRRAHRGDTDSGAPMEPGHPAVAWTRPEVRGQVQRARDGDRDDAGRDLEQLPRERVRARQDARRDVEYETDHDHVPDRPEAGSLAQRDPAEEDKETDDDRRAAEVERRAPGDSLRKHRPRGVAKAGRHQRSFPDPEQDKAQEEHEQ